MPTRAQLEAEPWWGREFAPPRLQALYVGLRAYLDRGPDAVGGKGDENHLRGYHRSREWILNSQHSAYGDDDYSIQQTLDTGGDPRWLSALDATPRSTETLIGMCQRLDRAVRAGQLPQVREWYGNLNGDIVVDGWDDVRKRAATSDPSHLWHLHISFYRSRADWDHTHLLRVLTGEDDDMPTPLEVWSVNAGSSKTPVRALDRLNQTHTLAAQALAEAKALRAVVEQLAAAIAAGGGTVDTAGILAGVDTRLAAHRAAVEADTRDAVADGLEGGAAAVRADGEG